MGKPDIVGHFRGKMEELKTADGITLYAHRSILDSETGSCLVDPWGSFKASAVERFLEHCYQGDCSDPKPVELPLATPASSVDGDEHVDGIFNVGACLPPTKDNDKDDSGSSENPNGLDYGEVFLIHAELYILSQTQGRSSLTALCLNRLREALDEAAKAPVRPLFAINLSKLLFHVYKHGNVGLIDDHQAHDLQNLVSSRAAMHIKEMKEECSFLVRCGGKMAEDLMNEVANRAIGLESASEKEKERKEKERKEKEKEREEVVWTMEFDFSD